MTKAGKPQNTARRRDGCAQCGQPHPKCTGHRKVDGGPCRLDPVDGFTVCWRHGVKKKDRERHEQKQAVNLAIATYGLPVTSTPEQALLDELYRTLGHVQYLGAIVAGMTDSDLKQVDSTGRFERRSVWVELYQDERAHLARVARDCISAGIEERKVAQLEALATDLVELIRRVVDRLGLTPTQRDRAQLAVAEELRALG